MKTSRLLIALLIVPLAACGTREVKETKETVVQPSAPVVRETVIEQPVIKETVIERPTVIAQPSPRSCGFAGSIYPSGSVSCQAGHHYSCYDGTWTMMGSHC